MNLYRVIHTYESLVAAPSEEMALHIATRPTGDVRCVAVEEVTSCADMSPFEASARPANGGGATVREILEAKGEPTR